MCVPWISRKPHDRQHQVRRIREQFANVLRVKGRLADDLHSVWGLTVIDAFESACSRERCVALCHFEVSTDVNL